MNENKKSPQVGETTGEELDRIKLCDGSHKRCNRCSSLILKSDNYCGYCGKPNNLKTIGRERNFKLSLFSLLVSIVVLIFILCSS